MALSIQDVHIFSDGLDHPECVAVHPDGSVWAGGEAGQIYRVSPEGGTPEIIANTGGFILGIAFSPDLSWLAICDVGKKCLWKLGLSSFKLEKFADGAAGESFKNPNYAVFDSRGKLYVSESGNFRQVNGKIFCYEPDGTGRIWHHGPFSFANGMGLSADEKFLHVVCTWLPGSERISILEDGSAGKREVYVTLPKTCPDGMALDEEGNAYISCYAPNAIYKINRNREVQLLLDDWEGHTLSNPTNIAFGGEDFRQLFIANLGRWHISRIDLPVKGLMPVCFRKTENI